VESKGLSVTLHWRQAPGEERWAVEFAHRWGGATGLELQHGRLAVELRPPVPGDKGTAVEELSSGCTAVCFLGDDAGDLPAFGALERMARSGTQTVRIAVASPECPQELRASADLVVDGPAGALGVLRRLAGLPPL
jgi:trehalose 6-phosphate phosphatase